MGLLCEYFAADTDEQAAGLLEDGPEAAGLPVFACNGLEPIESMAALEAVMTGQDVDAVMDHPRHGHVVAEAGAGRFVVTITDAVREGLAAADEARLWSVARLWCEHPEMGEDLDPEMAISALLNLASIARDARRDRGHLYCWTVR